MPDVNPDLQDALRLGGIEEEVVEETPQPLYRILGDTKIPVAKSTGKLWSSRIEQSRSVRQDIEACWSEAVRYYEHDQLSHRNGNAGRGGNARYTRNVDGQQWSETENVVFSNAVTMLPLLYAKNPSIEVTSLNGDAGRPFAQACEKLVNTLFAMKDAPGVNFKNKARRSVLSAYLMNTTYMMIDWVEKADSNEEALAQLEGLSKELENAKNQAEIREVEGKIAALEEKISFLSPSGPLVKTLSPFKVFVDPVSLEPDMSDAGWLAYFDFIPTAYLQAVYMKKQGEEYRSLYEPSHVIRAGNNLNSIEEEVNSFTLFAKDTNARQYGYTNDAAFKAAQYTKVWYVWDKTTRRVFLFSDTNWDWPLWVWDDPLKLLRFFPIYKLWFHETPEGSQPKGEVTYYLDQQDKINDINSTINQARRWAKSNVFFDKNKIKQDDVESVLKGPDGTARGVDVPEGMKLTDVIFSVPPPALAFPELLSTDSAYQSVNRITGINDAQRGAQFKTNTTNDAVNAYQKNVDIRVDEKVDAIEDWIGEIAWGLIQLAAQHWEQEDVATIIGQTDAAGWNRITDVSILRTQLNVRIVGGSTDKPTSKAKKQEAIQVGQVLGQFAGAIPAMGIMMLKMFERAFANEMVISQEDWDEIKKSMEAQQNKAGAGPNGEQGGAQAGGQEAEQDPTPEQKAQLAQLIRALPDEAKQAMDQLIQQGASPTEALRQVMQQQQAQPPA